MAATYNVLQIAVGTEESEMATLIDDAITAFDNTAFVRSVVVSPSGQGQVFVVLIEKP